MKSPTCENLKSELQNWNYEEQKSELWDKTSMSIYNSKEKSQICKMQTQVFAHWVWNFRT